MFIFCLLGTHYSPDVNRKSEILKRKTHGFVNIVYNRKRQRSAILHKIVVSLADFS